MDVHRRTLRSFASAAGFLWDVNTVHSGAGVDDKVFDGVVDSSRNWKF
jgi:hypothetical protein